MPFTKQGDTDVHVGPLNIKVARGTMPPDDIRLWEGNPRIQHIMVGATTWPSQEDLMAYVEKVQPHAYTNLSRDIEKFGQQEPVFLKAEAHEGAIETATVIEGNTRVAILKQLHMRRPNEAKFSLVQAYLLPSDFADRDLAILMANYHVKGTLRNQWDRYQIGAFLYEQIEQKRNFNQTEMANNIGKSSSWVSRHLTVFRFALEYKDELEGSYGLASGEAETETNDKFSLLEEAWKVKAFRDKMDDPSTDARPTAFRWVHEDKFKDHRHIRGIDELYTDPAKRKQIDEGGMGAGDTAVARIGKAQPLHEDLDRLVRRLESIPIGDLASVDRGWIRDAVDALTRIDDMIARLQVST